jgi:hypothetical protein
MKSRVLVLLPAVLALAVAGCTSSKSHSTTSTSATSPTTPATTASSSTSSSGTAPNKATLAGYVLKASDLPAGWKGTPSSSDNSTDPTQVKLEQCLGVANHDAQQVATVDSDDFANADATISSSAKSYRTADVVTTDKNALLSGKAESCFRQVLPDALASSLPAGAKVGTIELHLTPRAATDPENLVATISASIPVTVSGQSITAYVSTAYIVGPQVEAQVDFENVGAPVPAGLQAQLVKTVADRVAGK